LIPSISCITKTAVAESQDKIRKHLHLIPDQVKADFIANGTAQKNAWDSGNPLIQAVKKERADMVELGVDILCSIQDNAIFANVVLQPRKYREYSEQKIWQALTERGSKKADAKLLKKILARCESLPEPQKIAFLLDEHASSILNGFVQNKDKESFAVAAEFIAKLSAEGKRAIEGRTHWHIAEDTAIASADPYFTNAYNALFGGGNIRHILARPGTPMNPPGMGRAHPGMESR
jgi:hypothetical protein